MNPASEPPAPPGTRSDTGSRGQTGAGVSAADYRRATLNLLEDFAQDREELRDTQSAMLNILSDLSGSQARIRALNSELEARVRQRTAALQQANDALEAFASSVSHDLRAPLRAVSGFTDALVEDVGEHLNEAGRHDAARIQAGCERMGALIDDLLLVSRAARAEIHAGPVNLSAEAAAVAEELRAREPGRRVRLLIQENVWVQADRDLIRAVTQNLLDNAWKFTSRREQPTIEFGAAPAPGGQVCCYVRDNGAGFDPAWTAKLFQPFERLHSAAEYPGTGIGLATVQRIVLRHGGLVWAEGTPGGGAVFCFTLTPARPPVSGEGRAD